MKKRLKKRNTVRDITDEGSDKESPPLETMPEATTSTVAIVETTQNIDDSLWKKGKISLMLGVVPIGVGRDSDFHLLRPCNASFA